MHETNLRAVMKEVRQNPSSPFTYLTIRGHGGNTSLAPSLPHTLTLSLPPSRHPHSPSVTPSLIIIIIPPLIPPSHPSLCPTHPQSPPPPPPSLVLDELLHDGCLWHQLWQSGTDYDIAHDWQNIINTSNKIIENTQKITFRCVSKNLSMNGASMIV